MPYAIKYPSDAKQHLRQLSARDRTTILDAIEVQLGHEPLVETTHGKPLEKNALATWELRVGN